MTAAQSANIQTTKSNTIIADKITHATNRSGVFAAGDVEKGASLVVHAIEAGKVAAKNVDEFLRNK